MGREGPAQRDAASRNGEQGRAQGEVDEAVRAWTDAGNKDGRDARARDAGGKGGALRSTNEVYQGQECRPARDLCHGRRPGERRGDHPAYTGGCPAHRPGGAAAEGQASTAGRDQGVVARRGRTATTVRCPGTA